MVRRGQQSTLWVGVRIFRKHDILPDFVQILFEYFFPKYLINISINKNNFFLNPLEKRKMINHLNQNGYSYVGYGYDHNNFDYFHVGPIFTTLSHPNGKTIDEENISYISKKLSNIVLVGGINKNNAKKLLKYNFSGIAVMRELLLSTHPEETFLDLKEKINE